MGWLGLALGGGLAVCLALATLRWLRRRFLVVMVSGPSMTPTYRDGDRLLAARRPGNRLRAGQVVVVDRRGPALPEGPGVFSAGTGRHDRVVKRIAAVAGDPVPAGVDDAPTVPPGMLVLLGDNPSASVDSRQYGYVAVEQVVGTVLRRMR